MSKLATLPSDKYFKVCMAVDGFLRWVKTQPLCRRRVERPKPPPVEPQPEIDAATVAAELLEPEPLPPGLRKPYVYKPLKAPPEPKPKRVQDKPNRWYEPVCEFLRNRTSATVDEICEGLGVTSEVDRIKLNNALHSMARPGGVLVKAGTRPSHKGRDYTLWKLRQENKEPTT